MLEKRPTMLRMHWRFSGEQFSSLTAKLRSEEWNGRLIANGLNRIGMWAKCRSHSMRTKAAASMLKFA